MEREHEYSQSTGGLASCVSHDGHKADTLYSILQSRGFRFRGRIWFLQFLYPRTYFLAKGPAGESHWMFSSSTSQVFLRQNSSFRIVSQRKGVLLEPPTTDIDQLKAASNCHRMLLTYQLQSTSD